MSDGSKKLTDADYVRLADFRYAMRCFLEFSKLAVAKEGLTVQQHQALLVIRASSECTATIGRLAERLKIRHNSAVELVDRLVLSGLIIRENSCSDRRAVLLRLTSEGSARLEVLTQVHRKELRQLKPEIISLFNHMESDAE